MPRGGKRPGAGLRRGATRTQKSAEEIAARRRFVGKLYRLGQKPGEILEAIEKQAPSLLSGMRRPDAVIRSDIARIRREDVENLKRNRDLHAVAGHKERVFDLMRMGLGQMEHLEGMALVRMAEFVRKCSLDIARAEGVPTDRAAIPLNLGELSLSSPGQETPQPPFPGIVDAVTFATDPYFCGLSYIREKFPMQHMVLTEFMSPTNRYRILVLVCGMRSGKGVIGSVVAWYGVYQLLSLADPQSYYDLAPNQEIQIVNLATSRDQARNNVFKHLKDRLETGGEWFEALREQARVTDLEIRLPKNLVIRCGHSQATHQVGATSYIVILDELARFKDTEGHDNADHVYEQMSATTATFKEAARVLVLSSPEWEGDKAMRLLQDAIDEDEDGRPLRPHMLGVQLPTWECNRNLSFDYLWEAFEGAANPTAFWRDFGARPPHTVEGYYPDPERWVRQAGPDREHPYDENGRLGDWFKPCCDSKRFVHVDLGATRDACGLAMAHKPVPGCPWYEKVDGEDSPTAKRIVVDVVLQIVPPRQREHKGEISFERVRQHIRDWQDRGFNVKGGMVSFDGWQSLDSRQILKREGFRTKEFSLDRDTEGHDTLQELVNTDALGYYRHDVLIREAQQLQLVRGKKVEYPKGGSKDVVDAVAGAVYHALKMGGRITFVG